MFGFFMKLIGRRKNTDIFDALHKAGEVTEKSGAIGFLGVSIDDGLTVSLSYESDMLHEGQFTKPDGSPVVIIEELVYGMLTDVNLRTAFTTIIIQELAKGLREGNEFSQEMYQKLQWACMGISEQSDQE